MLETLRLVGKGGCVRDTKYQRRRPKFVGTCCKGHGASLPTGDCHVFDRPESRRDNKLMHLGDGNGKILAISVTGHARRELMGQITAARLACALKVGHQQL